MSRVYKALSSVYLPLEPVEVHPPAAQIQQPGTGGERVHILFLNAA